MTQLRHGLNYYPPTLKDVRTPRSRHPDLPLRKRLRSSGPVSPPQPPLPAAFSSTSHYRPLRSWEVEEQNQRQCINFFTPGYGSVIAETNGRLSELERLRLKYGPHLHPFETDMLNSFENRPLFGIYHTRRNNPGLGHDNLIAVKITVRVTVRDDTGKPFRDPPHFQQCSMFGDRGVVGLHYPEPNDPRWCELSVRGRADGIIGVLWDDVALVDSPLYVFAEKL